MFSLSTIIAMNNKAARKSRRSVETETSRHCSFTGSTLRGIVLHSAKLRNTVHLDSGRDANDFLARYSAARNRAAKDALIESYFGGAS
jgi:hypothetical protein